MEPVRDGEPYREQHCDHELGIHGRSIRSAVASRQWPKRTSGRGQLTGITLFAEECRDAGVDRVEGRRRADEHAPLHPPRNLPIEFSAHPMQAANFDQFAERETARSWT